MKLKKKLDEKKLTDVKEMENEAESDLYRVKVRSLKLAKDSSEVSSSLKIDLASSRPSYTRDKKTPEPYSAGYLSKRR